MAVCLRCGKQLGVTARFCGTCGYPVNRQQTATTNPTGNLVPPQIMTREQLITEIDRMLIYFSKVQDLYDEYDRYVEIQNAEQGDDEDSFLVFLLKFVLAPFTHEYADLAKGLIWLGLVILVFGVFILISEIFTYYKLIAIGCFLVSGLLCYIAVILFVENSKNMRQERKHMESVIANLKEYHENYGYCLVTFENANPKMLHRVRDYLVSGQAYTLDDALRLAYD